MDTIIQILARELGRSEAHVENVVRLIDEGNTIPFIARYRKELHGAMDDTALRTLADRLQYLRNLDKRREEVKSAIEGQGKLTEELSAAIDAAATLAEVEDLYRPYKQKRRTRATVAREKGLEPLAELLFAQAADGPAPEEAAGAFIDPEKGVETAEDALQGASDIIAERISDDADIRKRLRELVWKKGSLVSAAAAKEPEDTVYRLYYAFRSPAEPGAGPPGAGHQPWRAGGRAQGERGDGARGGPYPRPPGGAEPRRPRHGLCPRRRRGRLRPADLPLGGAGDAQPAHRAGRRGGHQNVRPQPQAPADAAAGEGLCHHGPGSRLPQRLQGGGGGRHRQGAGHGGGLPHVQPAEEGGGHRHAGKAHPPPRRGPHRHRQRHRQPGDRADDGGAHQAAGRRRQLHDRQRGGGLGLLRLKLAAEEFPDYDVNLRSAVSIARRLQDPLAELVKIDPKSIGVGQYQHDMPQARLDETLSGVVEDCVNAVGVDLNTASAPLLSHVAGLNNTTARNIVKYREENGAFTTRKGVLKVPKLGPKAFEQCAGFLRVPESRNVLDHTGVHPESYGAAEALLTLCGYGLSDVKAGGLDGLRERVAAYGEEKAAQACGVGVPTLRDIVGELMKPGRDPRDELPRPILRTDVLEMKDLKPGMELTGTVRNVIDFGVFVDIGVHQDGLVHISQLREGRRVQHPSEVCAVGDIVTVWVLEVDEKKKRISLTMKKPKG